MTTASKRKSKVPKKKVISPKKGVTNAELLKRVVELERMLDGIGQAMQSLEERTLSNFIPVVAFKGKVPKIATEGSAGFDLYADNSGEMYPGRSQVIKTGTYVQIPKGYVGLVKCRSGLGFKRGAEVFQGVIDSDFRGEIQVKIYNNSIDVLKIKKGDRFAQLLVVPCITMSEELTELDNTDRDKSGFGSTGR